jgi:hypothetical protein
VHKLNCNQSWEGYFLSTKKTKHKPVIYISQPITQFPDVMMQERYSSREETSRKSVEASNENVGVAKKVVSEHRTKTEQSNSYNKVINDSSIDVPIENEVESNSNPFNTLRKKQYSLQRVKHFREMSVSEKLAYLEKFPEQLAPISCLYFTEATTYTGFLLNQFEDRIEIQLPNNTKASISLEDLQDIRMLGFH